MAAKRPRVDDSFDVSSDRYDDRLSPPREPRAPSYPRAMWRGGDCYRPSERSTSRPPLSRSSTYEHRRDDELSPRLHNANLSLNTAAVSSNGMLSPPEARPSTSKSTHHLPLPTPLSETPTMAIASPKPMDQKAEARISDAAALLSTLLSIHTKEVLASVREDGAEKNLDFAKAEFTKSEKHHKAFPCMKETSLRCLQDAETELRTYQQARDAHSNEKAKTLRSLAEMIGQPTQATHQEKDVELKKEVESLRAKVGDMTIEMGNLRQTQATNYQAFTRDLDSLRQSQDAFSQRLSSGVGTMASLQSFRAKAENSIEQCATAIGKLQAQVKALNERGFSGSREQEALSANTERLEELNKLVQDNQAATKVIEDTIWGNGITGEAEESQTQKGIIKWIGELEDKLHNVSLHINENDKLVDEQLNSLSTQVEDQSTVLLSKANKLALDTSVKELKESNELLDGFIKDVRGKVAQLLQDVEEKDDQVERDSKNLWMNINRLREQVPPATEPQIFTSENLAELLKGLEGRLSMIEAERTRNVGFHQQAPPLYEAQSRPQPSNDTSKDQNYQSQLGRLYQELEEHRNQLSGIREMLRFLEDRYNNVTTDEVVKAMVRQVQHLHPIGRFETKLHELHQIIHGPLAVQQNSTANRLAMLENAWPRVNEASSKADNAVNTSLATTARLEEYSENYKTLSTRVEVLEKPANNLNPASGEDPAAELGSLHDKVTSLSGNLDNNQSALDHCKKQFEDQMRGLEESIKDTDIRIQQISDTVNANNLGSNDYRDQIDSLDNRVAELSAKQLYDTGVVTHKLKETEVRLSKLLTDQNGRHEEVTLRLNSLSEKGDGLTERMSRTEQRIVDQIEHNERIHTEISLFTKRQEGDYAAIKEVRKAVEGVETDVEQAKTSVEEMERNFKTRKDETSAKLRISSEDSKKKKEKEKRKIQGQSGHSDKKARHASSLTGSLSSSTSSNQRTGSGDIVRSQSASHLNKKVLIGEQQKRQDEKHKIGPYAVQTNMGRSGSSPTDPVEIDD